jgi:hypothetical protein
MFSFKIPRQRDGVRRYQQLERAWLGRPRLYFGFVMSSVIENISLFKCANGWENMIVKSRTPQHFDF